MSMPYAFINAGKQSLAWYRGSLLDGSNARAKFDELNGHISGGVTIMPGQLIIVADDSTSQCTPEEQSLMRHARHVKETLVGTDEATGLLLVQNYDMLQDIMTYSSIGVGSVTSAWSTHLNQVRETLNGVTDTYQKWRSGVFDKDQFVAQRQKLFRVLDGQLRGIGRWGTGLKKHSTIKKMMGISSKRYVHSGELSSYVKNIKLMKNLARHLSAGTPVGVALDLGQGGLEIREACTTGREQQCTKAKFVEVGKMAFGIPAAGLAGSFTGASAAKLCLRMAGPSRGASLLVCGIAGGALGGWGGGKVGSAFGDGIGTWLYEVLGDD